MRFLLPSFAFHMLTVIHGVTFPNVVIFMADDMGIGDCSAYQFLTKNPDKEQLHTPAMEKLARMGMLFTDAHAPSSRCTSTRYSLLTGRYSWRTRMKHWVLFGAQGDPLIEEDRPTLASLFKSQGYRTAMVGKWHLGLRYTRSDGKPAADWEDADLSKFIFDGPCDHGFDFARFTSRSHGTSGVEPEILSSKFRKHKKGNQNSPYQEKGPGHIHNRRAVSASGEGKKLMDKGSNAYVLHSLGSRHSDHALDFLEGHLRNQETSKDPFFLYYPSNANHGPYTPDKQIGEQLVKGVARTVSGEPTSLRLNYVFENDVAVDRLLNYLENKPDPRLPSRKLIQNTLFIFTSDNGAEVKHKSATGPFRSNKGSCYEGGHRVPFLISWPDGKIGNGNPYSGGKVSQQLIGLQDLYATFSNILRLALPDLREGEKGAEDSYDLMPAFQGKKLPDRPMFYHDHKEGTNGAASAMRLDNPVVSRKLLPGKWKIFFDDSLLRAGEACPIELFELSNDPMETQNLIEEKNLQPLIKHLVSIALLHRNTGGHRFVKFVPEKRFQFDWRKPLPIPSPLTFFVSTKGGEGVRDSHGLGIKGGDSSNIEPEEALAIRFESDVLVESVGIAAGRNGSCGGSLRLGNQSTLPIYCTDADMDDKDQQGIISDLGVLKKRELLILDPRPHLGVEKPGSWKLESLVVRPLR